MDTGYTSLVEKLNIISIKLSNQTKLTSDEQIIYNIISDINEDISTILQENIINPGYTDAAVQDMTDHMLFLYDNILSNKNITYD
jgi:hypothetical protein